MQQSKVDTDLSRKAAKRVAKKMTRIPKPTERKIVGRTGFGFRDATISRPERWTLSRRTGMRRGPRRGDRRERRGLGTLNGWEEMNVVDDLRCGCGADDGWGLKMDECRDPAVSDYSLP